MARYIPGGRVVLSDGTFEFGGSVSLSRQKTWLVGMGGSTHIRPETTGFSSLLTIDEVHCRIRDVLLLDSGDDLHDVQFGVRVDDRQSGSRAWPIVENVHTHGLECRFDEVLGPAVINHEWHSPPDASSISWDCLLFFSNDDIWPLRLPRVHGGFFTRAGQMAIRFRAVTNGHIEGVHIDEGSESSLGTYPAIRFENTADLPTDNSSVVGCTVKGANKLSHAILEQSGCESNAFLGNNLNGSGQTADLEVNGTGSVSAANHADGTVK